MSVPRLLLALLLPACGGEAAWDYACEEACGRLYAADQCALSVGEEAAEDYAGCERQCQSAYGVGGFANDAYRPATSTDPDLTYHNEAEARRWLDCVDSAACVDLRGGACPPTW